MTEKLSHKQREALFNDTETARQYIEKMRWPDGKPVCPHCGCVDDVYRLTPKVASKSPARLGVLKCKHCRKQFTVTVGTIFEGSHIPLNKWLQAIYFMCTRKKGISAHQLHRMMGVTYKSAWFMVQRIRHAMFDDAKKPLIEGTIEADETYVGGKGRGKRGRGTSKAPVFSLIERNGKARSCHVDNVKGSTLTAIMNDNVNIKSQVMTDSYKAYNPKHQQVGHSREYIRGTVHTNVAESYFSLLKRGILGTFHHVSKEHLQRYLDEFDFRWTHRKMADDQRMAKAVMQIEGKRLHYRDSLA
ncbi:MAG: IS1595 family transposase [Anaerolineales bacterium]|nr:IS1595 family transposase [Anaerolineales bacterium]